MVPYNVQDEDLSVRPKWRLCGPSVDLGLAPPLSGSYRLEPSSHRCKRSTVDHQGELFPSYHQWQLQLSLQGRLYSTIDTASSVWQLEPRTSRQPGRERTISTASTTSTHSSYAFVSDPDISSSFAASLESGQASDADDVYSASPVHSSPKLSYDDEVLEPIRRRKLNPNPVASRSVSPGHAHPSMTSSFSSLDSFHSPQSGRLLTVHLEKQKSIIWPSLIVGPVPESLSPSPAASLVFDASLEMEQQYNMDPTSLALIALELSDIRKDKEEAFEYFL